jgi:hypothetical protein
MITKKSKIACILFLGANFHTMAFENKEELGNFCFFGCKTLKKAKKITKVSNSQN